MVYLNELKSKLRLAILGITLLTWVLGCSAEIPLNNPSPIPESLLVPYRTSTPTQVPEIDRQTESPQMASLILTPTPTPFVYTIVKDDTLTSIAYRHGISVNDLITANPEIDPNFLSVGISITIPITGSIYTNSPGPTPIPLKILNPICYPDSSGGQWCLSVVMNTQPFDVENVSAQIYLNSPSDENPLTQVAISPLNILPKGRSATLAAYFPPPIPNTFQPQVELTSVIPVHNESQRYLDLSMVISSINISDNRLQAEVSGEISLPNENQIVKYVWIAAFAYDLKGNPIGFRKWVADYPMNPGETYRFHFVLYSLGPFINEVEILYEAKP